MTSITSKLHPPGDKPVDSVDNRGTRGRSEALERPPQRGEFTDTSDGQADRLSDVDAASSSAAPNGQAGSGRDLARAALEAARQKAKSRGTKPNARSWRAEGAGAGAMRSRRRRWSGSGADDRDPQPLGRMVSKLAKERGWNSQLAGGQVFGQWAALVGEEVAEHAQPEALKDGELILRASSTAWATQLRLLQGQLLTKIAAGVGGGVVKRIRVLGPSRPSWRYGMRHVSGRGPRDTYG